MSSTAGGSTTTATGLMTVLSTSLILRFGGRAAWSRSEPKPVLTFGLNDFDRAGRSHKPYSTSKSDSFEALDLPLTNAKWISNVGERLRIRGP